MEAASVIQLFFWGSSCGRIRSGAFIDKATFIGKQDMRKAALWLGLAFILGTGIVLGLALSAAEKPEGSNGFRRIFRTEAILQPIDTLNLKYDSYYIAGRARQTLYLGNIVAPRHAFAVNIQALDTQRIEFKLYNPE